MDYILIDSHFDNPKDQSPGHGAFLPYGLIILHSILQKHGFEGKLLLEEHEYLDFLNSSRANPQPVGLIGLSASTWTRFNGIRKIKECRQVFPGSLIVAGGVHFGNCAEDSIRHIPELDIVIRGEAEDVILDLMLLARAKKKREEIGGITFRGTDGQPVNQGERLISEKLPPLDFMDRFYTKKMFSANPLNPAMPIPSLNVLAGRGCPYRCIFCSVCQVKHRHYPINELLTMIEKIQKNYGIKGVKFWDDSFTINESFVQELCQEILRRKLKFFWFCDSRANINLDLLPLMYQAGCRFVGVGLESGSPRIQKIVGKNITNEQVMAFAAKCKEVGIRAHIFLMISLPDETPADIELTIKVANDLVVKYGASAVAAGPATILPGTALETIARQRGILPKDFSWAQPYDDPINMEYGQSSIVPVYREMITPQMFADARKRLLSNFPIIAAGYSMNFFVKKAITKIFNPKIPWAEKAESIGHGWQALHYKFKRLLTSFPFFRKPSP